MNNLQKYIILFVLTSVVLIGCDEDQGPITSDTMTIVVNSLNQSDINDIGIIEKDENISNNSGNPWGEFIKEVEADCGKSPNRFEIISVSVQLSDQDGINVFEDLVSSSGNVYFISTQGSDADAIRVNVGSSSNLEGSSANELTNLASSSDLKILNERLVGGDFHIGFSGETNLTKDDEFSFDVVIRFVVKAHCE